MKQVVERECEYVNVVAAVIVSIALIVAAIIGYCAVGQFAPQPEPMTTVTYPSATRSVILDGSTYERLVLEAQDGVACRSVNSTWMKMHPDAMATQPLEGSTDPRSYTWK